MNAAEVDTILGAHFPNDDSDVVSLGDKEVAASGKVQYYITLKLYEMTANAKPTVAKYYPLYNPNVSYARGDLRGMVRERVVRLTGCDAVIKRQLQRLTNAFRKYAIKHKLTDVVVRETPDMPFDDPKDVVDYVKDVALALKKAGEIVPVFKVRLPQCNQAQWYQLPRNRLQYTCASEGAKSNDVLRWLSKIEVDVCRELAGVENYFGRLAQYINDVLDAIKK